VFDRCGHDASGHKLQTGVTCAQIAVSKLRRLGRNN
jgi:hypothetical protein